MRAGSRPSPLRGTWLVAAIAATLVAAPTLAGSPTPGPASPAAGPASPAPGVLASPSAPSPPAAPSPSVAPDVRVEQAFRRLTTDADLVGQLLLLGWNGRSPAAARDALREFRPAGLVLVANASQGSRAAALNAAIAAEAAALGMVPPIRAVDHEGGSVQRLKDLPNRGPNGAFGRLFPTDLEACQRGLIHAVELRALGFDMNLAPVVDVATNPRNPVIGDRAYGGDPELVARLGAAYVQGLQGGGVMGSAKHFPGHGDTRVDSHLGLPVIKHDRERLDAVELLPFRRVMEADVAIASLMVGHLALPRIDARRLPASLSHPIVTGLLREELGWDGLVVSDDLGAMDAVTDRFAPGDAAVLAVTAGVDLLILVRDGDNQEQARDALLGALQDGRLERAQVERSVRRVLGVKARFGLLDGVRPLPVACPPLG